MDIKQELIKLATEPGPGDLTVIHVRKLAELAVARLEVLELMHAQACNIALSNAESLGALIDVFGRCRDALLKALAAAGDEITVIRLNAFKRGKSDGQQEDTSEQDARNSSLGGAIHYREPRGANTSTPGRSQGPIPGSASRENWQAQTGSRAPGPGGHGIDHQARGVVDPPAGNPGGTEKIENRGEDHDGIEWDVGD